jgi:hypothetical protein
MKNPITPVKTAYTEHVVTPISERVLKCMAYRRAKKELKSQMVLEGLALLVKDEEERVTEEALVEEMVEEAEIQEHKKLWERITSRLPKTEVTEQEPDPVEVSLDLLEADLAAFKTMLDNMIKEQSS